MKEILHEVLIELGFRPEETEIGFAFRYEGANMLLLLSSDDDNFLNITVPGILDCDGDNTAYVCALMEKINSTLKYIKSYVLNGSVWLCYERELFGGEKLEEIVSRMIMQLEIALRFSRKTMQELDSITSDSEEEICSDIVEAENVEISEDEDNDK